MSEPSPSPISHASSSRRPLWTAGVFFLAASLVLGVLWIQLQIDRDDLVSRIERERLEALEEVVRLVGEDVDDVVNDLALLSELLARTDEPQRAEVLTALLASVDSYLAAAVFDGDGPRTFVLDPRRPAQLDPSVRRALDDAVIETGRTEGVMVSPPVSDGEDWFRIFGSRTSDGLTMVLVVDTSAWLSGLRLVSSDPLNRILVLGRSGTVTSATDESIRHIVDTDTGGPAMRLLLERMRRGERGTMRLSGSNLAGFEPGYVVVAFAPVEVPDSVPWSVATFTSTAVLRAQEEALAWRFFIAAFAIVLLLIGFAWYATLVARRQAVLVEGLRHAQEMSDINAQLLHAEKLATVGGLSAGIAHEIGTPLGVVRGRAEYLLRKLGEDHPHTSSLFTIIEQIDRVSRIIRELLDFARPRPARRRPTRLDEVAHRVQNLLMIEFDRAELTLTLEIPPDLPPLAADEDQLQQVLINLLINSRDACSSGCNVTIAAEAGVDAVSIVVSDDGPGITEEFITRVFDPFFTTKKRGQGTGLGLSVVSQIIRSHAGEVSIDSGRERGTVVRIRWPVATSEPESA